MIREVKFNLKIYFFENGMFCNENKKISSIRINNQHKDDNTR